MRTGKRPTRAAVGDLRLGAFDQAEVGRGAAGVERHQVGKSGDLGDDGAAERARGRPGKRRRDRLAHDLVGAGDAAARLHDQKRLLVELLPQLVADVVEIAAHMRLDERIDQRRHRPLVFAVFGKHVGRERKRAARIFLRHDLSRASFMRGVGVGVHEAYADRGNALGAKEARGGAHARLVERPQLGAEEIEAAADLAHIAQRHQALGLHPEIRIAVALGHRLAGDLENVAEAFGDDEAETGDLVLQQRIGRDRRAVREHGEIVDAGAALAENGLDAAHERHRRVRRRARDLGHAHGAGFVVDANDVGKGAAGVDADPQRSRAAHPCSASPAAPIERLDREWRRPFDNVAQSIGRSLSEPCETEGRFAIRTQRDWAGAR